MLGAPGPGASDPLIELAHWPGMRRRQLLEYWMSQYGQLSAASQKRFLQRQDTRRLARYPDDIIRKAIS
jgi:hypothetical protein